jgi:signal transduction histidine kinase
MHPDEIKDIEKVERQKRLQWSVVIRYLVIFIVVFLSWIGSQYGASFFLPGILFSVAIALGFNLALSYLYSQEKVNQFWPYAGVVIDMLVITSIVHFTGGISSVFLPLYLLQIVGTNVQFSRLAGPLNFIIGTACFLGLYGLERNGIFAHYVPFSAAPDLYLNTAYVTATSTTLIVLMAVSTYRSGYVIRSLQKIENQLEISNRDLVHANQAFQAANARLKELDQLKTEFISVASHQLRTPLSGIKWALKMLLDRDLGALSPDQEELVHKSYLSNERMIALINDLLDVSRIEENRFEYNFRDQQLPLLMKEVMEEMQHLAQEKRISIHLELQTTELPGVRIDNQKMQLALTNLLDNSIKYTPSGGTITIRIYPDKQDIVVSIQDSGVGIPIVQQGRIFAKFFRGDNVIRMQTEGTGLGLFIAKSIIQKHNGRIWFESSEGKGTTFYIALPKASETEIASTDHFEHFVESI